MGGEENRAFARPLSRSRNHSALDSTHSLASCRAGMPFLSLLAQWQRMCRRSPRLLDSSPSCVLFSLRLGSFLHTKTYRILQLLVRAAANSGRTLRCARAAQSRRSDRPGLMYGNTIRCARGAVGIDKLCNSSYALQQPPGPGDWMLARRKEWPFLNRASSSVLARSGTAHASGWRGIPGIPIAVSFYQDIAVRAWREIANIV